MPRDDNSLVTGMVQNPSGLHQDSQASRFLPLLLVDTDHPIEEAQSSRFVPLERIPPDN
mgnify:CR=1 FL=1